MDADRIDSDCGIDCNVDFPLWREQAGRKRVRAESVCECDRAVRRCLNEILYHLSEEVRCI